VFHLKLFVDRCRLAPNSRICFRFWRLDCRTSFDTSLQNMSPLSKAAPPEDVSEAVRQVLQHLPCTHVSACNSQHTTQAVVASKPFAAHLPGSSFRQPSWGYATGRLGIQGSERNYIAAVPQCHASTTMFTRPCQPVTAQCKRETVQWPSEADIQQHSCIHSAKDQRDIWTVANKRRDSNCVHVGNTCDEHVHCSAEWPDYHLPQRNTSIKQHSTPNKVGLSMC
jgi:hypothetical protein